MVITINNSAMTIIFNALWKSLLQKSQRGIPLLDIKINYKRKYKNCLHCPFCSDHDETFEHTFKCNAGLRIPKQLKDFMLQSFSMAPSEKLLKKLGYFLDKYNKYRQEVV